MLKDGRAIASIAQGSLSQRAYSVLRDGLINGHFRPGQRLVMQDLADQLGTSITPVREACMRLVSEGGLQLRSGRFAIVPPMTLDRYMEVRLMRLELEGLAAEIAAKKATPEDLARLHEIHPLYTAADKPELPEEAFRLNREFHFAVYGMSRLPMLVSHIESLWTSMGPMLTIFFIRGRRTYYGADTHKQVIERIEAGDGAGARDAIRRDIMAGGVDFIRFLEEENEITVP
ncbi:GntR family transcriptional regulator [Pseudoxanthobacter sp. M-2]|uniref:GntR family transcriptional regulator n=1 Tax=Pseudoxanthobacter sp. M-2 TaxID=3078754 RepID=UPI0038FC7C34